MAADLTQFASPEELAAWASTQGKKLAALEKSDAEKAVTIERMAADLKSAQQALSTVAAQKAAAEQAIRRLTESRAFARPIVTEVSAAPEFFPAEDYHQEYYERNPRQPYCQYVVAPKVAKFRQKFVARLKT